MSRIFVSHSSENSREARALKLWLSDQRPALASEIFLDIDPDTGLQLGDRWKSQLFQNKRAVRACHLFAVAALGRLIRMQDRIPHR